MEDDSIDGESVSFGTNSKRKAEEMLGAKDGVGDVHTSIANKGSMSEDETGARIESSGDGEGMIKNPISTLFRPGDEGGENEKVDGENEAGSGNGERVNRESASEEGNGDSPGGLLRNIMSHLPPALPDAAPSTDEASILIHSIIHD